jgi:small-conductance mechanosensitive channel
MPIMDVRAQSPARAVVMSKPVLLLCLVLWWSGPVAAQGQAPSPSTPPVVAAAGAGTEPSNQPATLTFANRPIVTLRARVLGRDPADRVASAERVLDELIEDGQTGPIESRTFEGGAVITVASRGIVALTSLDVDNLAGETVERVTAEAVAHLQQAIAEADEARTPQRLLVAFALASLGLAVGGLLLWGLVRLHRAFAGRLVEVAERRLTRTGITDVASLRASRVLEFQRGALTSLAAASGIVVVYTTLTFVLRRFPYTRPWGESMRGFLLTTVEDLALGVINAIPGLFTVALIVVSMRFILRLVGIWFTAVEQGRTRVPWLYPDTAQPTRRLVTVLIWMFTIVVAYPYMPGSQTDAFKGVSVFLGLMLTFGSSGLVNQIMSGFMVTYSRALRVGDYVRIGDVEGTVIHLGILSTKLKTYRGEEATIPNAVVVSQTTTDYSRFAENNETFTPTTVTIGYDAPWRQVQALLLQAAERTSGLQREPKPYVLQEALQDFYVKYTLFVCLERQEQRYFTLNALHAHIQDLFNEYGVQIMSPNYVLDPTAPKVVARQNWYAAPASVEEHAGTPADSNAG